MFRILIYFLTIRLVKVIVDLGILVNGSYMSNLRMICDKIDQNNPCFSSKNHQLFRKNIAFSKNNH